MNTKKKYTVDYVIKKAREIHGDKYDYSDLALDNGCASMVTINCPVHGPFPQIVRNHLRGQGCPRCHPSYRDNQESFLRKVKALHPNLDFSNSQYIDARTAVTVRCPEHGEFQITPRQLLHKVGCPRCSKRLRYDTELFIEEAENRWGKTYDYSKTHYVSAHSLVTITCPEHGDFKIKPYLHLQMHGCPACSKRRHLTKHTFEIEARKVHGDRYSYEYVEHVDGKTPIRIICPEHGEFWQTPAAHLQGQGCPKCAGVGMDTALFIEKARKKHGDRYDYSLTEYTGHDKNVKIKCPVHGVFEQKAYLHLSGQFCPMCQSSKLEETVREALKEADIVFEERKYFKWLKAAAPMHLDFYLPKYHVAIECQGIQHFEAIDYFGGQKALESAVERDDLKRRLCKKHGIEVLYFTKEKFVEKSPYPVIVDTNELIEKILK